MICKVCGKRVTALRAGMCLWCYAAQVPDGIVARVRAELPYHPKARVADNPRLFAVAVIDRATSELIDVRRSKNPFEFARDDREVVVLDEFETSLDAMAGVYTWKTSAT